MYVMKILENQLHLISIMIFLTFQSKIDSNFDIYRKPYYYEIIERRSSNET